MGDSQRNADELVKLLMAKIAEHQQVAELGQRAFKRLEAAHSILAQDGLEAPEVGALSPAVASGQTGTVKEGGGSLGQPGAQPTIKQMILHVLEAHGGQMSPGEMYRACQRQSWRIKHNSFSATLSKLVQAQVIVRVGEGQYTVP
jgi:hypothetical protein